MSGQVEKHINMCIIIVIKNFSRPTVTVFTIHGWRYCIVGAISENLVLEKFCALVLAIQCV